MSALDWFLAIAGGLLLSALSVVLMYFAFYAWCYRTDRRPATRCAYRNDDGTCVLGEERCARQRLCQRP